ncbi:PREDICTED: uncharacterized protein LOC106896137 isoform X2 [Calidris pugnax]|uniref:uncharacterized protein LOC106896137 isoform X2 n=1 Tax=Calidris pugnax TaxID=198806 RepID=UPI00071CACEC|nr:PREDICTED: uncharacterized protein LOC106896137 isoform X2 [Calidris pugnax]
MILSADVSECCSLGVKQSGKCQPCRESPQQEAEKRGSRCASGRKANTTQGLRSLVPNSQPRVHKRNRSSSSYHMQCFRDGNIQAVLRRGCLLAWHGAVMDGYKLGWSYCSPEPIQLPGTAGSHLAGETSARGRNRGILSQLNPAADNTPSCAVEFLAQAQPFPSVTRQCSSTTLWERTFLPVYKTQGKKWKAVIAASIPGKCCGQSNPPQPREGDGDPHPASAKSM